MTTDELLFFNDRPRALPLYEALTERLLGEFPDTVVKVNRTQISFAARFSFAFVSLRRIRNCPEVFIIVSFGIPRRLGSPRVAVAVEPYPGRWTHHVVVGDADEIDDELMGWLREARKFALTK